MRALVFVAAVVFALLCPASAAAKWTELRSEHFTFVGDASEGQIRRVAERLEQFREALVRALPGANAQSPVPTVVMVFDTERTFAPVRPLFRGKPVEVAGFFLSGDDANYLVINAEFLELATLAIFHEYAHFLVNNSQMSVPLWVSEGLAELYQVTQQVEGGRGVVIGRAPAHHIELLKASTLMPIRELLAVDHASSVYNEGNRRSVLYAQSWAFVHYLTLGSAQRAAQFRKYLSGLRGGTADAEAFAGAFGPDVATLDRELFDYVRQFSFPAVKLNFEDKVSTREGLRGRTLPDDVAETFVADVQARVNRLDEAKIRLAAVQKRNAKVGRVAMVLGLAEMRAGRGTEGLSLLERAAALEPDDVLVQGAYARALALEMSRVRNDRTAAAALYSRATVAMQRATALEPSSARLAWMLGYVELVGGGDVRAAAAAIERATILDPSREEYRLNLAQALGRNGEYDRATAILGPLMAAGRTPRTKDEARRLLTELADRRARRARVGASTDVGDLNPGTAVEVAIGPLTTTGSAGPLVTTVPTDGLRIANDPESLSAARAGFVLRVVQPGEQRTRGRFEAVECVNGTVVLRVASQGRSLALRADTLANVDFISYRADAPKAVNCGPIDGAPDVLATFRPTPSGAGGGGDVVAIELLPDGFTPEGSGR